MTTVYTNPPTTQSSALDEMRRVLNDSRDAEQRGNYNRAAVARAGAAELALVSIAETLAALLPATQEIAGALAGAYSPDAGALAVVDANAAVERVEPYPNDEIGKGATSAQITTDEAKTIYLRFINLRNVVRRYIDLSDLSVDTSELERALRETWE